MSELKLPYVFLGSYPIGPIALETLKAAYYPPVAVIDNPALSTEEQIGIIEESRPTFLLVVGYGAILKRAVLDTVAGQVLNIHPSLLPAYRGPSPVPQAILDGARETGVTLMEIDTKMDHGPILAQEAYPLSGTETSRELFEILTRKGVRLFLENIDDYLEERLEPLPQDHSEATITHFIKKEDGLLDLSLPANLLERRIRAFQGWPRTWVTLDGKRLLVDEARIDRGRLFFTKVQPEGGKPMAFTAFAAGRRLSTQELMDQIAGQAA